MCLRTCLRFTFLVSLCSRGSTCILLYDSMIVAFYAIFCFLFILFSVFSLLFCLFCFILSPSAHAAVKGKSCTYDGRNSRTRSLRRESREGGELDLLGWAASNTAVLDRVQVVSCMYGTPSCRHFPLAYTT